MDRNTDNTEVGLTQAGDALNHQAAILTFITEAVTLRRGAGLTAQGVSGLYYVLTYASDLGEQAANVLQSVREGDEIPAVALHLIHDGRMS